MRRLARLFASAIVLLLVTAVLLYYALLHTEPGARWLLSELEQRLGGNIELTDPRGDLSSGLSLSAVHYDDAAVDLNADKASLALTVEFFPLSLRVTSLELANVRLVTVASDSAAGPPGLPDSLVLPIAVHVEKLIIDGFDLLDEGGGRILSLQRILLRGQAKSHLDIEEARVSRQEDWISLEGQVLLQQPYSFDLELAARAAEPLQDGAQATGLEATASLSGEPENYLLTAEGRVNPPDMGQHEFRVESAGSMEGLDVSLLTVKGPAVHLETGAKLDWQRGLLALSGFEAGLADSASSVQGDAQFDLQSGEISGELDWSALAWPLNAEPAEILSRAGSITLSGDLDQWVVKGEAELERPGLPPGKLAFEAIGDRDQADVRIAEGEVLGGTLAGNVQYRWRDGGVVSAALSTKSIDTTVFFPDMPAVVDAELELHGLLDPVDLEVDVKNMVAATGDRNIEASGKVRLAPGAFTFEDALLQSAGSQITLNGNTSTPPGLGFTARVPDLGDFLPGSRGSLQGRGSLGLGPDGPTISLDLQGRDFSRGSVRVPEWNLADLQSVSEGSIAGLKLHAMEPELGEQRLEAVTLQLDLGRKRQSLGLLSSVAEYQVVANVEGEWTNPDDPLTDPGWNGKLEQFTVSRQGDIVVGLRDPAALWFDRHNAALEQGCLDGAEGAGLCVSADWQDASRLTVGAELSALPMAWLRDLAGMEAELDQLASGTAEISVQGDDVSGEVAVTLTPGRVKLAGVEDALFETGESALFFRLDKGRLTGGKVTVPIAGQGGVNAEFRLDDFSAGLASGLEGKVGIELADLEVLSVFFPMADDLGGRLSADLALSGTLRGPVVSGPVELADGRIGNNASGLLLNDIRLSGNISGARASQLRGSFRAVDGVGELTAGMDFSDILSPRIELGIRGDNLTLFDSDTLKMTVDPDLLVTWTGRTLHLDGRLFVPSALVAPKVIPVNTVSESKDVEIVAGEVPVVSDVRETEQRLAIHGDLAVELGDDVRLDFSVVEASATGSVDFHWEGDWVPVARGNYSLVGEIQAFGQLLEITEANIGFPNVAAINPHLNIRAERQIFGNSEIRRAGVLVTGTMKRPVIEPYTDPMTNRERARTLLVTGSDFNMERGVGAVDIGTYIAPRVFVSYGIGVFEDENVISIRYDLGRNWGVKATSGERQTGIDISYTLER